MAKSQSDGGWEMTLCSMKIETGCSISTIEESNRFEILKAMDFILINRVQKNPHWDPVLFLYFLPSQVPATYNSNKSVVNCHRYLL